MKNTHRQVPKETLKKMSECFFDDQEYIQFMDELRDLCVRVYHLSTDREGGFAVTPQREGEILGRAAKFLQQNIELANQLASAYFDEECDCCG